MKYLLILLLVLISNLQNCFSQTHGFLSPKSNKKDIKTFIEFTDTLYSLQYDFNKLLRQYRSRLNIEIKVDKQIGNNRILKFNYNISEDSINSPKSFGHCRLLLNKNKPLAINNNISYPVKYHNVLDKQSKYVRKMTDTVQYLNSAIYIYRYKNEPSSNYEEIEFIKMNDEEKNILINSYEEKFAVNIIRDYCKVSFSYPIYNRANFFYSDFGMDNQDDMSSSLLYISELYEANRFATLTNLMYSHSALYNWFIAEALCFFDKQKHFLNNEQREKVESYNGKNGFPRFRRDKDLQSMYIKRYQQYYRNEDSIIEAKSIEQSKRFVKFLDSLYELKNLPEMINNSAERFNIVKQMDFKAHGFQFIKYFYAPIIDTASGLSVEGKIAIVFVNKKPLTIKAYYTVVPRGVGPLWLETYSLTKDLSIPCKNCRPQQRKKTTYSLFNLEKNERSFIIDCVGDSLSQNFLADYEDLSHMYPVINHNFNLSENYDGYRPDFDSVYSYLSSATDLLKKRQYLPIIKLMNSKSIVFNWFVAEALHFYNDQDHFLTKEQQKKVESFNGKNGFIKFREDNDLAKLYMQ